MVVRLPPNWLWQFLWLTKFKCHRHLLQELFDRLMSSSRIAVNGIVRSHLHLLMLLAMLLIVRVIKICVTITVGIQTHCLPMSPALFLDGKLPGGPAPVTVVGLHVSAVTSSNKGPFLTVKDPISNNVLLVYTDMQVSVLPG